MTLENTKLETAGTAGIADKIVTDTTKLFPEVIKLVKGMPGGVSGLVKQFQDKGLANVATWLTDRASTQTISPEQIVQGLGTDNVNALATASGLDVKVVRKELVTILPKVVQQLAPAEKVVEVAVA
jgi:uncharacterized protein YidB (DUF937 family)